jgi:hypothetical protein
MRIPRRFALALERKVDRQERSDSAAYVPPVVWTVKVTAVAHGPMRVGDVIEVRTGEGSGDCGVFVPDGVESGFLAYTGYAGTSSVTPFLTIGSCSGPATPDDMRAYRPEMPPSTGSGPAVALVATQWGPARLVAIDDQDRPLGYGFGTNPLDTMVTCPDGATIVGLTYTERSRRVERWNVATMTLVSATDLKLDFYPDQVRCDATEIVAWGEGGSAHIVKLASAVTYDAVALPVRPAEKTLDGGLRYVAADGDDTIASVAEIGESEYALIRIKPDGTRTSIVPGAYGWRSVFLKLPTPVAITSVAIAAPAETTTSTAATTVPSASTTTASPSVAIAPTVDGSGATWQGPAAAGVGILGVAAAAVVVRRRRR